MGEGGWKRATKDIFSLTDLQFFMIAESVCVSLCLSEARPACARCSSLLGCFPAHDLATGALSLFMAVSAIYQGTEDTNSQVNSTYLVPLGKPHRKQTVFVSHPSGDAACTESHR